jgi:hypothetical protein
MLKERTPFTGCRVVCRRAAAKFPAAVMTAAEPGRAKGSNELASIPYQTDERFWFHTAGEDQTSSISGGRFCGDTTRSEERLKLAPTFDRDGYSLHNSDS